MGIKDIKSKRQEGFTIIEVMIVLVIAAVILLMVFLAVPALQRNSRNTQRKNDVANVLAAVSEYSSNNNGQLPSDQTEFDNKVMTNVKLGYYDDSEVHWNDPGTLLTSGAITNGESDLYLGTGSKCNGNSVDAGGGSSRQFLATFNIESAGGIDQEQCQEG